MVELELSSKDVHYSLLIVDGLVLFQYLTESRHANIFNIAVRNTQTLHTKFKVFYYCYIQQTIFKRVNVLTKIVSEGGCKTVVSLLKITKILW